MRNHLVSSPPSSPPLPFTLVSSSQSRASLPFTLVFAIAISILSTPGALDAAPESTARQAQRTSGCNAPTWQSGAKYHANDIVHYSRNGQYYVATHDNPGYDPTISTWFWSSTTCGGSTSGGTRGGADAGTGTGTGVAAILSESAFHTMFPQRNRVYNYQGLVQAASSYAAFATSGDTTARKREVAAFLANVGRETGNLIYIEEINKSDSYCAPKPGCPCAPGHKYYGRGSLQLSWNYNYCAAGNALHLPLQSHPELVATDAKVMWQTGLWFWMTSTGAGSKTSHAASVSGQFGETIRTINGGLECNGKNRAAVQDRVQRYQRFCKLLGVDPGNHLGC